jgi:hypothetical protein
MTRMARPLTMLAVVALTVAGLTTATAPAEAAACSATRSTTVKLSASGYDRVYVQKTDYKGNTTSTYRVARTANVGAPTIVVTTCKSSKTGKWKVLESSFTNHWYDVTVTESAKSVQVTPRSGDRGWGVFALGVSTSQIKFKINKCVQDPAPISVLGVTHGVLGLPIPVKSPYAVAMWIVDKLLPAAPAGEYRCGQMTSTSFDFTITTSGKDAGKVKLTGDKTVSGSAAVAKPKYYCGDGVGKFQSVCQVIEKEVVTVARP